MEKMILIILAVPIQYGYDAYFEKYGTDERFVFKKYKYRDRDLLRENRG